MLQKVFTREEIENLVDIHADYDWEYAEVIIDDDGEGSITLFSTPEERGNQPATGWFRADDPEYANLVAEMRK